MKPTKLLTFAVSGFGLALALGGCGSSPGSGGTAGTTGSGGSSTGTAGTTGSGGSSTGTAGTTGAGGSSTGTGGSATGTAGSGAGGTGVGGSSGGSSAGSGGSGGSGSGGSGGSSTGGAGGGVSCATLPFCDDFESGTAGGAPDASKWTVDLNFGTGTVQIDGAQKHAGAKSLHVVPNGNFHTMAMAKGAPLFPLPAGALFGRVYVRLAKAMSTAHVIWIEAGSIMNDTAETRIGANLGELDVNRMPGDADQRAPGVTLAAGQWTCLEFMFDNMIDEARVWLNSTEIPALHVTNWVTTPADSSGGPLTNWAPDYQAIRFGWELNSMTGEEIWFDDVALGYTRIGCLP
jgi:hypothetical protein